MLRTKKTLRALAMLTALVMAFSLTSVVAFADATTVTVDAEVVDEATSKISVTGTISVEDADVTILALRDAAEVTAEDLGAMDDETLASKIVYINQEAAVEGAYAFSFVPKAGVSGGIITVFVGGEGVDAPQSTTVEVLPSGATLTVEATELTIGDDLVIALSGLEAEDEAAWAAAITEITVGEEVVTGTYDAETGTLTVSGLAAGEYANIVIKATDYKDATFTGTIAVALKAAPVLEAEEEIIWSADDAVITVTGDTAAEWLDAVVITATAGEDTVTATIDGSTIVLSAADYKPAIDGEVAVTVSFADADEFEAVEAIVINVVSPVKDIMDNDVIAVTVDKESDEANYIITLPANTDAITYAIDGYEAVDGVVTVARPAEGEEDITVNVIVTITNAAYEEAHTYTAQTVKVNAIGKDGPTVDEGEAVYAGSAAYGDETKKALILAVEEGEIDPATQSIKVGTGEDAVTLYYVEATGKFVGIIGVYDNLDALNAAIEVVDEASPVLYYGRASNPTGNAAVSLSDVARVNALRKGTFAAATDAMYIAADVLGTGNISLSHVAAVNRVRKDPTAETAAFTVYSK